MKRTAAKWLGLAAIAGLALTGCSASGSSAGDGETKPVTLSVATFLLDNTPNGEMVNWWLDHVEAESEGTIKFDRFPAESLCTGAEIVQCVSDGRADLGVTPPSYTPDKFPLQNLAALPFMTDDNQAMMAAFDALSQESEQFAAESERIGLHNLAYWPAGASLIGAGTQMESVDDLKGVKIRAVGDGVLSAMNAAGASPIALTAGEMYEGVDRGVIDAVVNNMDAPIAYKLTEVLPHWIDTGYGHYITIGFWISNNAYDSLSDEQRAVIDEAQELLVSGAGIDVFSKAAATQCDFMLEQEGVTVTRWSDDAIAEFKRLTGDSAEKAWIKQAEDYGVTDAAQVLEHYKDLLKEHTSEGSTRVAPLADCAARFADR